jgi:hypothetical protein
MTDKESELDVPEDPRRLIIVEQDGRAVDIDLVIESLRKDLVVLIRNVGADWSDNVIYAVADRLDLSDSLKLQAACAGFLRHRDNIGKYFMTVNRRDNYQFISPHSEGNSFIGMQLASFFCFENSTDGGETILMNIDDSSESWQAMRERVTRGRIGSRTLATREISRARAQYQVNLPADVLKDDDLILQERRTEIPDLSIVDALAKPKRVYSRILKRNSYVYWDSVASIDFDSASEYVRLLRRCGLLKEPPSSLKLSEMDNAAGRRIWYSGVKYSQLFKCKITRKLAPGDLVIQNNLTWTHAVSNWSPSSGTRTLAASFA